MKKQLLTIFLISLLLIISLSSCATDDISEINNLASARVENLLLNADPEINENWISEEDLDTPCQILFVSNRDGDDEIFSIDLDSSNLQQLTFNSVTDAYPTWSPEGEEICFSQELSDGNELFLMNKLGDEKRQITFSEADFTLPAYSPNGEYIACISQGTSIYVINSDGGDQQKLATSYYGHTAPAWAPDNSQIVYSANSEKYHGYGLYLINNFNFRFEESSDETSPQDEVPVEAARKMGILLQNDETNYLPNWSPDGEQILFSSDVDGDLEIYMISSTISENPEPLQITSNQDVVDSEPIWSPDGKQIAFSSNRNGNYDIFIFDVEEKSEIQITNDPGFDRAPTWSPNGKMIAFVSDRDGSDEIFVIQSDGKNLHQLTVSDGDSWWPKWMPGCICE